uniref:Bromo domain-containing protein n=1 Tax=Palpitomonas bilix TaxID=652834 RepID=A0A7S3CZF6_9EUKA
MDEDERAEKMREKLQRRAERVAASASDTPTALHSLGILLAKSVDPLLDNPKYGDFADPITVDIAPDYVEYVSNPMDLSTLQLRARALSYDSVEAFRRDLYLIESNCEAYCTTKFPDLIPIAKELVEEWENRIVSDNMLQQMQELEGLVRSAGGVEKSYLQSLVGAIAGGSTNVAIEEKRQSEGEVVKKEETNKGEKQETMEKGEDKKGADQVIVNGGEDAKNIECDEAKKEQSLANHSTMNGASAGGKDSDGEVGKVNGTADASTADKVAIDNGKTGMEAMQVDEK